MIELIQDYWLYFLIGQYPNGPLGGLVLTLLLASCGLVLALPLGIVLGLARVSPWRSLRWPVSGFVFVVRGLPLLMVIFWAYFFLPSVTGVKTDQFATMLIALVVFDAAYLAEIVRAGIEGLPSGQAEAARAIGLNYRQAMTKVVLPQALYNMVPALVSQFVSTIKETSLGYVISVNELTFAANQINSSLMTQPFQVYFVLAAIYFCLCFSLTRLARWLERRIAARREGDAAAARATASAAIPSVAPQQAA